LDINYKHTNKFNVQSNAMGFTQKNATEFVIVTHNNISALIYWSLIYMDQIVINKTGG